MQTDNPMEGDDVENDLESENLQVVSKHTSNEIISHDVTDIIESESDSPAADKCPKLNNCQRSSNRLNKRTKKENNAVDVILKKAVNLKEDAPSIGSKTRRPWELWSVEDKNAFFEALCEYGKDFESIQSYIAQRSKKKGTATNMIKNKDQVRHFYYRTWHKISKFLEISECVQKQTQELYGLINYAELRKKIGGCLNEKNRLKLNELVFSGVTTVKYKGKKLRIKTPVCRALKKLNNFADSKEPESEKLPKDILVEFRPHTNTAWMQVQDLAQNPRVRTKVCLQKRLKPVIEYLQRRWRPHRLKRREQVLNSLPNCISTEYFCDNPLVLRVKPPRDVKIFPLSLSAVDTASSSDVCLEKYMKLSHNSLCKDINKSKKVLNTKPKSQSDKLNDNGDVQLEKVDNSVDNKGDHCDNFSFVDMPEICHKGNKNSDDSCYINLLTPPKSVPELEQSFEQTFAEIQRSHSSTSDSSVQQACSFLINQLDLPDELLASTDNCKSSDVLSGLEQNSHMNSDMNFNSDCNFDLTPKLNHSASMNAKKDLSSEITEREKSLGEKSEASKSKNISSQTDSIFCKTVKEGWTADDAGFLTFGELYLLFGKPSTIILEYEFEYTEATADSKEDDAEKSETSSELSPLLNKVFELAHAFFTDSKHKQLPGKQHGRNNSSKATKPKSCGLNDKTPKDFIPPPVNTIPDLQISKDSVNNDVHASTLPVSSDCLPASDKHVFVMPVGTAPRSIKHPDQNSLKEEIGKLLPSTRRGCRVRRKPLVVQRPLLPRDGMRPVAGSNPMTVVHFVPSVPPLATVIPSSSRSKNSIPSAKKVVKILSPGTTVDIHPIQVPVIKQLHSDSSQNVILHRNSVQSPHVIVNSSSTESLQIINSPMPGVSSSICEPTINVQSVSSQDQVQSSLSQVELSSAADLNVLNLDLLTGHKSLNESKEAYASLSQLSLSGPPSSLASCAMSQSTSFLDELGLTPKNSLYDPSNLTSCLNVDVSTSKECSSSDTAAHQSFKMNSSDIQWLNGESTEVSLNTFLNSMESPSKLTSTATSNSATENSNLDPIIRLAPVVDSQVRCLLDECSIDFITKFEDLADVINNSSSSDSKQT